MFTSTVNVSAFVIGVHRVEEMEYIQYIVMDCNIANRLTKKHDGWDRVMTDNMINFTAKVSVLFTCKLDKFPGTEVHKVLTGLQTNLIDNISPCVWEAT